MDPLNVNETGGVSISLDDIQAAYDIPVNALQGFINYLTGARNDDLILGGMKVTDSGSDKDVEAGYAFVNGELFAVSAHTGVYSAGGSKSWFWKVTETNVSGAITAKQDGGTITKRKTRTLTLVYEDMSAYTSGVNAFPLTTLRRASGGLTTLTGDERFTNISLENGWTGTLTIFKSIGGIVTVWGDIDGTSATSSTVFTIPDSFAPFSACKGAVDGSSEVITASGNLLTLATSEAGSFCITYFAGDITV